MSPNDQEKLPPTVVKNGEIEILVFKHDGTNEIVKVKLVPLRQVEKYYERIFDLPAFAEFVTGKADGWADTLDDDSLWEIDRLAKAINDPRFDRLLTRQTQTVEAQKPIMARASALTNTSPTP